MNDCINAEVRNALPDLMHGRLGDLDKATMTAHVESCADCREELRLLEEIRSSAPFAPRIDVARIVAALPAAMPSSINHLVGKTVPARSRHRASMLWKMTAAAALLVTGSLTFATARRQATPVAPANSTSVAATPRAVAPQTAAPDVSQSANQVAGTTTVPAVVAVAAPAIAVARAGLSLTGGVQDLSDDQLRVLLDDLDNVQGLPAAEPEAMTISVDDNEGLQ